MILHILQPVGIVLGTWLTVNHLLWAVPLTKGRPWNWRLLILYSWYRDWNFDRKMHLLITKIAKEHVKQYEGISCSCGWFRPRGSDWNQHYGQMIAEERLNMP